MLEIDSIRVGYGNDMVLDGLSWRAGTDGAVVTALLGPSGCGKSTLIRAVAGLEQLRGGAIRFDGDDLSRTPTHRRDFGVVFQDGQLFSGRSVATNVGYGLRMRRWRKDAIDERVDEMLRMVELSALRDRRVEELSGGQAQRVALARALAPRPRLLLLDEPLTALDRRLREDLAVEIGEIVRATATPTIVVTHDHVEAALLADEVSVMRAGEIVQTDAPTRLWQRPVDEWTARFLGCASIVDGHAVDGRVTLPIGDAELAVDLDVPDGPVQVGLRPESAVASLAVISSAVDSSAGDREAPDTEVVDTEAIDTAAAPADGAPAESAVVVASSMLPSGPRLRIRLGDCEIPAVATEHLPVGAPVAVSLSADRLAVIGQ